MSEIILQLSNLTIKASSIDAVKLKDSESLPKIYFCGTTMVVTDSIARKVKKLLEEQGE